MRRHGHLPSAAIETFEAVLDAPKTSSHRSRPAVAPQPGHYHPRRQLLPARETRFGLIQTLRRRSRYWHERRASPYRGSASIRGSILRSPRGQLWISFDTDGYCERRVWGDFVEKGLR